ncbi:MAG: helix-turn-helix domain-containing protein [Ruminococcus sp.]|nr:helix-turn-helix domain-containing protein [Ruminococcus sp.]
MIYSDKLREVREEKNLKQEEISNILSIDKSVYGKYEREYILIPIKHLNNICNYFNISLDYIFSFSEDKNYSNSMDNIDLSKSALRLKEFRKDNKLTQVKLAELLNVANGTVAEYERGNFIISTPFLYTICKKYNISADYLLGKIDNPKYLK